MEKDLENLSKTELISLLEKRQVTIEQKEEVLQLTQQNLAKTKEALVYS